MLNAASLTPAVLDRILAFLATLFLPSTAGDIAAARGAAAALLASYDVRTDRQLRLAALAIAFSLGALDSLSRAAEPDLPANQVLRLRGNANALNRAAHQNEAKLEKLTALPETAPKTAPGASLEATLPDDPQDLPASSDTPDLLAFLRAASATPALSRQQRRFAERQADKQRLREQEAARLEERVARRLAEKEAAHLAVAPVPLHQPEAVFAHTA